VLTPTPKRCDISVKKSIQLLSTKLDYGASPIFYGLTLRGLTASTLIGANADKLLESVTIGTGLDYTRPTLSLSHLGIEALTDPGADRIFFWDNSASASKWLGMGNSVAIIGVTLDTIQDIRTSASPTFIGLTLSGKVTSGSFASPVDVTNTRQYGFELHYSGNNYDVTGIRSRARLKTTDTTATAQGALLQAANEDGINAGVLNGALIEAIGKSDANAATIAVMRGALINTEWGDYDTVTNLKTLHVRTHSRNAAGAGSFGTGYGLYIENEAVGGNGQALDAGIYFKGTNLSAGNKAFTYGIDFSGGTFGVADINLTTNASLIAVNGATFLANDGTANMFLGEDVFNNSSGTANVGLGYRAGYNNDASGGGFFGGYNVYIGNQSGYGLTTGVNNTGYNNVAIGNASLIRNTTGYNNVAIGNKASYYNNSGYNNVAIGGSALLDNIVGRNNIAIGANALFAVNSLNNVAIGIASLRYTTGRDNMAVGTNVGYRNAAGNYNVAFGSLAMYYSVSGDENVIIGYRAGFGSVVGESYSDNVFIGSYSGYKATTGSQNIYLGYRSGYNQTTNSNRLIIDNRQRADVATELTNAILYGIMAATPADQWLSINAHIIVDDMPVGSDQANAGAAADELWVTSGHATLPDNVVMRGV